MLYVTIIDQSFCLIARKKGYDFFLYTLHYKFALNTWFTKAIVILGRKSKKQYFLNCHTNSWELEFQNSMECGKFWFN